MNYDRFVALALKQIADKGRDVTLLNKQLGAYNPISNTQANGNDTARTVRAVFTEYKASEIDGEVILRGDKQCLMAAITPGPSGQEKLIDGGSQYNIIDVKAIQPGDEVILYKLQVRR